MEFAKSATEVAAHALADCGDPASPVELVVPALEIDCQEAQLVRGKTTGEQAVFGLCVGLLEIGHGVTGIVSPDLTFVLELDQDVVEEDPLAVPLLDRARGTVLPRPIEIAAWCAHYHAPDAADLGALQGAGHHGPVDRAATLVNVWNPSDHVRSAGAEAADEVSHRASCYECRSGAVPALSEVS